MRRVLWATALPCLLAGCVQSPSISDANLLGLGAIAGDVFAPRLAASVQELSDAHLGDTPLPCPAGMAPSDHRCHLTRDAARALLRQRLIDLGFSVTEQAIGSGDYATTNVFADKVGTTRPDELILVGAHFDAFYGGADDNSSGVAALLEIARVLSTRSFDRTIRFIGFDLEELGLVGSTRYVEAGPGDVVAAIVFDCIGFSSSAPHSQASLPGLPSPDTGDFITVVANDPSRARALEARGLNDALSLANMTAIIAPADGASPLAGNLMRSDHAPFWVFGHDALFFTDTANFRNPNYHQDTDLPATVNPAFLADVTELAAVTVAYWAGGPR